MKSILSTAGLQTADVSRRKFLQTSGGASLASALLGLGAGTALWPGEAGAAQARPIADFLATQGTACVPDGGGGCYLFVPPAPNFLGWNTILFNRRTQAIAPQILFAGVDYAGLANRTVGSKYGTTTSGTLFERPLADGRAEVMVMLQTSRANTWVIELDLLGDVLGQIANKPTLFGYRPDFTHRPQSALADCRLEARFTNTAVGAPLPDLAALVSGSAAAGQALEFIRFSTSADGPLTTQYPGVADGTPGHCTISQTDLVSTAGRASPNSRLAFDGFPAELIELRRVGQ